jgi:hypothetical protein
MAGCAWCVKNAVILNAALAREANFILGVFRGGANPLKYRLFNKKETRKANAKKSAEYQWFAKNPDR